jgi:hypothetical protein
MDREDETAEEINNWSKGKTFGGLSPKFYFHKFRVYQLEEVADIIDFGTARTYGGNKIIIEYEYHLVPELNPNYQPDPTLDPEEFPYDPNKYLPIS